VARLYFNLTSPYARKVRVAVIEAGLEDRIEPVECDPWASPPELIAVTPLSKVPALVTDEGLLVTESETIVQALDVLAGGHRLLPADPVQRLHTLARSALAQGLIDAAFVSVLEGRRPEPRRWSDWVERQHAAIGRALDHVERRFDLADGRFDAGDIGLACALAYLDFRLPAIDWRTRHPRQAAWFDAVAARPSMQRTRPN
jgi:glutathione S-transferase